MNIFLQFANEVFKASQKLEDAIKADFNSPELLETNKPKDDRDGAIWKFGQLGTTSDGFETPLERRHDLRGTRGSFFLPATDGD